MSQQCELGPGRFAHASGALWLLPSQTVIVADAHLGYGWAQRRRGELGPVKDTKSHPRLRELVDELQPKQLVFLGDLVHAPRPCPEEREAVEGILDALSRSVEIVLVRGNHDRGFARDFGHLPVTTVDSWSVDGVTALHGDRLLRAAIPDRHILVGHLHPVMKIRDAAGASQKLRVFLVTDRVTVLPAFSPYSAGFDVARGRLPANLRELIGPGAVEGVAVTGKTAMRIGVIGKLETSPAPSRKQ